MGKVFQFIILAVLIFVSNSIICLIYYHEVTMYLITEYSPSGIILNTIQTNNWKYNSTKSSIIVFEYETKKEYILQGTCEIQIIPKEN